MSLLSNIDRVSLASSYPTDKIVQVFTGSFNTTTSARQADSLGSDLYAKLVIPHGYTRPVFTKLKWSLDGITYVDGGLAQLISDPLIQCIGYSTPTDIVILSTQLSGLIYYQVICFWIDDYDATNPLVDSFFDSTKPLAFDSRLNYQKILMQGELTFTGTGGTQSVSHNLGYMPNVWLYFESNPDQVWQAIQGGVDNVWLYNYSTQAEIEYGISITDLNITLTAPSSASRRVWYRIYAEGS